jgi:uncharacterized protein YjbI with pentapeptide repeats
VRENEMRSMTNELRERIQINIKNKIDIADLIKEVIIKGEDLSHAIISKLNIVDGDISGTNFSNTILGNDTDIFTIIRTNMENCNFNGAKFIGKAWIRSCNAKNCNFKNADLALVDYEYTNAIGSTFCGAKITIDSRGGLGAMFDPQLLRDLCKDWANKIKIVEE